MAIYDEKDYIMRMIKEIARVLFSVILGRQYVTVELPAENKYRVSGTKLEKLLKMIDDGAINEAENMLLDGLNYSDKEEVAAAIYFYQYLNEKSTEFLCEHRYSREEVLDGLKQIARKSGYGNLLEDENEV